MPASRASASLGVRPTPSTIASAAIEEPSASSATGRPSAEPPTARRPAFSRSATPLAACSVARCADTPGCTLRAQPRLALQHRDLAAGLARRGGNLQPDPAAAHDQHMPVGAQRRARSRSASARVRSTCTPSWSTPGSAALRAGRCRESACRQRPPADVSTRLSATRSRSAPRRRARTRCPSTPALVRGEQLWFPPGPGRTAPPCSAAAVRGAVRSPPSSTMRPS